jgi:UDP-glucuronate decarboxylase
MQNTVLITGAAGFIGSNLAEYFLKNNYVVIGVDNFATGLRDNADFLINLGQNRFYFFEHDVCQGLQPIKSQIDGEVLRRLKWVFHFASPASPPHYQRLGLETLWVNTIGLQNCLEFADNFGGRVIFASTSEVYGDPQVSPQPESYWGSVNSFGERSCYDEAKRMGEALIFTYNKKYNKKHGLVRIFNTYGPRMNPEDGRVVVNFITQALAGKELTIYGDGRQTRSFCYVDDLVRGIISYAASNETFPMNLGNDKEFNMLELAEVVRNVISKNSSITYKPLPADDPKQRRPDLSFAQKRIGYMAEVSLETGIRKMTAWLQERQAK